MDTTKPKQHTNSSTPNRSYGAGSNNRGPKREG